jgi:hypothetical protein
MAGQGPSKLSAARFPVIFVCEAENQQVRLDSLAEFQRDIPLAERRVL